MVDDPASQFLPDGIPLPEAYQGFLRLLKINPLLIKNFRYIFGRYIRHANRNGDWKNVVFFGREIIKHRSEDINVMMLLARGLEQSGNRSELQEAISLLEKLLVVLRKGQSDAKIKEAQLLLRSVRGKLAAAKQGLPQNYVNLTDVMLLECSRTALIEYIHQARADKNYVRAAFLSTEFVRRFCDDDNSLRNLASDLERAGLIEAAYVIHGKIQWVDRDEQDDARIERLRRGLPQSYLDVNDEIFAKCGENDFVYYASQARKACDFDNAVRFQERLAVLMPNEVQTAMRFAGDLYRAGNLKRALDVHKRVADILPDDDDGKKTTHIIIRELEQIVKKT